jgi:hypothetical protein
MTISRKLALGAFALTTIGGLGVAAGTASAVTLHCDSSTYPNKINIDGGPTVQTNLTPGTTVCIKSGTAVALVTVAADGTITNDQIFNTNGKAKGISYYAWGAEEPPCEYPEYPNCEPPSS